MKKLLFTIFAASLFIMGCNKSDISENAGNNGPGKLSVKITDDPFNINIVESATVTITKIEIRKAGETTENPFIVVSETPVTKDLIDLRNGITAELANIEVPAGDYDLVRLYVDEATLKIKDQADPYTVKVPSGQQTGIKVFIDPPLHVVGGISTDLVLDFDLSKSFVMRGNIDNSAGFKGFIFKPAIRAVNNSTDGTIEGFVKDTAGVAIPDAKVWIEQGENSPTTYTGTDGHYSLVGVPAGTYTVSASQTGFETADAEGVVVVAANRTTQDFTLFHTLAYVSSAIEASAPDKLVMTYNLKLAANSVPDAAAFAVTVNTAARGVNTVTIDGSTVVLTLATPVVKGDIVTVAYTKPGTNMLKSTQGSEAESISAQTVTNNVQ